MARKNGEKLHDYRTMEAFIEFVRYFIDDYNVSQESFVATGNRDLGDPYPTSRDRSVFTFTENIGVNRDHADTYHMFMPPHTHSAEFKIVTRNTSSHNNNSPDAARTLGSTMTNITAMDISVSQNHRNLNVTSQSTLVNANRTCIPPCMWAVQLNQNLLPNFGNIDMPYQFAYSDFNIYSEIRRVFSHIPPSVSRRAVLLSDNPGFIGDGLLANFFNAEQTTALVQHEHDVHEIFVSNFQQHSNVSRLGDNRKVASINNHNVFRGRTTFNTRNSNQPNVNTWIFPLNSVRLCTTQVLNAEEINISEHTEESYRKIFKTIDVQQEEIKEEETRAAYDKLLQFTPESVHEITFLPALAKFIRKNWRRYNLPPQTISFVRNNNWEQIKDCAVLHMGNLRNCFIQEGNSFRFRLGLPRHRHGFAYTPLNERRTLNESEITMRDYSEDNIPSTSLNQIPANALNSGYELSTNSYPMRIRGKFMELWKKT